jgi:putative SOS response-associated peptidase YedK
MCGRYLCNIDKKDLRDILEAIEGNNPEQTMSVSFLGGEIFPGNSVPVITAQETRFMIWGYPSLAEKRHPHINARSETAATKRTFSAAMIARRCLIPASCYYEWKSLSSKKQKEKYEFKLPDAEIMYMAGIYSIDYRFAILTREATPSIAEIHNRMPVIIPKSHIEMWLRGSDDVLQEAITDLIFTLVNASVSASLPPSLEDEQPTQLSLFS